nr:hypothetical protein Iba_chr14cCG6220 [Ipomoea batatas]GMD89865.1 hypothetical protein Iba_chr14dCG4160 [Ipomoea batatas]
MSPNKIYTKPKRPAQEWRHGQPSTPPHSEGTLAAGEVAKRQVPPEPWLGEVTGSGCALRRHPTLGTTPCHPALHCFASHLAPLSLEHCLAIPCIPPYTPLLGRGLPPL